MEEQEQRKNRDETELGQEELELVTDAPEGEAAPQLSSPDAEIQELNNKYLRLYADFDNYRKRVNKEKEELARYGNEALLYELLPAIDNLELALKHATGEVNSSLVQGVEVTLKELQRTLEKFGLTRIASMGQPFDPAVHHAMSQVEREDLDDKMVAEEFRAGYRFRDKVLRPTLVAVSVRPRKQGDQNANAVNIKIQDTIEEEQ